MGKPAPPVASAAQPFSFDRAGGKLRLTFSITAPAQPATASIIAAAEVGDHFSMKHRLPLLRPEKQKIHDRDNKNDGRKGAQRTGEDIGNAALRCSSLSLGESLTN